jgi:hypothetical protein
LYVIINQYGDSSNNICAYYQTGSGTYFLSTDKGTTWGAAQTGEFRLRTYNSKLVTVILENTKAIQRFGVREKSIPFRNKVIGDKTVRDSLISAAGYLGKEKRIYDDIQVSATEARIPLGAYCRFYDKFNGLNINAIINSYTVEMTSGTESNLGATSITLKLEDWY